MCCRPAKAPLRRNSDAFRTLNVLSVLNQTHKNNFFTRIKPEQPGLTRMNVNAAAPPSQQSSNPTIPAPPRSRISRFNFLPPFLLSSHIAQFYHPSKKSVGSPSRNRKTPLQLSHYQPLANAKKSRTPSKPDPKITKPLSTLKKLIPWTPKMTGCPPRAPPPYAPLHPVPRPRGASWTASSPLALFASLHPIRQLAFLPKAKPAEPLLTLGVGC